MAAQKFANNASALLAASISDTDTTIQVDAGYGALFPNPGANEYFVIALENSAGDIEICKVTARSTDLLTVVRGWEDTVAQAWTNGVTRVELRNTAGSMRQMIQRTGDTMEGNLDMDGFEIVDSVLTGETVIEAGSIIKGATITNAAGDLGNAITIPSNSSQSALVGGSPILTEANFDPNSVFAAGMIVMWWGDVNEIPDGWALCDGNNGRPDLRNRFVVGVGSDYDLGDTGGSTSATTSAAGGHTPQIQGTALTANQLPEHGHRLWVWDSTGGNANTDGFKNGQNVGVSGQSGDPSNNAYRKATLHGVDLVEETGAGEEHTHTATAVPDHTHTVSNTRPPYFALYFIIKVDPAGSYGGAGTGGGGDGSMYDMYNEDGCTTYIGGQATLMDDLAIVGSNVQINCCASNVFKLRLTSNVTILAPNNPISGQVINIILKQDAVGSRLVTWDPIFMFPGGSAPSLSTDPGARDVITCQWDSDDEVWYCNAVTNFS